MLEEAFTQGAECEEPDPPAEMDKVKETHFSAEVAKALRALKNGKAPGSLNILPEMLKVGCREMRIS